MNEFELETSYKVRGGEPIIQKLVLSEGQSVALKLQQLLASTPPVGSIAEKLKFRLTRTVPTGKEVTINLSLLIGEIKIV